MKQIKETEIKKLHENENGKNDFAKILKKFSQIQI